MNKENRGGTNFEPIGIVTSKEQGLLFGETKSIATISQNVELAPDAFVLLVNERECVAAIGVHVADGHGCATAIRVEPGEEVKTDEERNRT